MATTYTLNWSDPAKGTITLAPGQKNTTASSLTLFGENTFLWGEGVNENMMQMLENFAGPTQPANLVEGQLWYDNAAGQMRVWNGSAFVDVGGGGGASGTAGDAPADRTTVLVKQSDQVVAPSASVQAPITFSEAARDPFSLYGAGTANNAISTADILYPPNATKMKISATITFQTATVLFANDYIVFSILNTDYEGAINFGSREFETNGVMWEPSNSNWTGVPSSYALSPWQHFETPWIEIEPTTNAWQLKCVNGTGTPVNVTGRGFSQPQGAGVDRNFNCVLTIEYDFS